MFLTGGTPEFWKLKMLPPVDPLLVNNPPVFGWLFDPDDVKSPPLGLENNPDELLVKRLLEVFEKSPLPLDAGVALLLVKRLEKRLLLVGFGSSFFYSWF